MAVGAILGALAAPVALATGSYIPGKMEREYRKQIKYDIGKMRRDQAEAPSLSPSARAQAVTQQGLAQLARGSAQGAGASGMQQAAMGQAVKAGQQVAAQEASAKRGQQLAMNEAMRQDVLNRMLQARNMERQRRGMALGYLQSIPSGLGAQMGGQFKPAQIPKFEEAAQGYSAPA